jgi:hypothetical protein
VTNFFGINKYNSRTLFALNWLGWHPLGCGSIMSVTSEAHLQIGSRIERSRDLYCSPRNFCGRLGACDQHGAIELIESFARMQTEFTGETNKMCSCLALTKWVQQSCTQQKRENNSRIPPNPLPRTCLAQAWQAWPVENRAVFNGF